MIPASGKYVKYELSLMLVSHGTKTSTPTPNEAAYQISLQLM